MYLVSNGNLQNPQLKLAASAKVFTSVGNRLKEVKNELKIATEKTQPKIYTEVLEGMVFKVTDVNPSNDVSTFKSFVLQVNNQWLYITGSQEDIHNLGASLTNCFDENTPENYHIHVDYFEGNVQKAGLVIICSNSSL